MNQSKKCKNWDNKNWKQCGWRIVSFHEKSDSERQTHNHESRNRSKRQNISWNFFQFFRIIVYLRHFANADGIESQIRQNCKNRKIIIDFGIHSIAARIEIIGHDFDEKNRNQTRHHFSGDLRERVGINFFCRHANIVCNRKKNQENLNFSTFFL